MISTPSIRRCTLLAALGAATLLVGCKKGDDKNAFVPPPPPEVVVSNPVERDITEYLMYTGTIEASEKVELRARVQGFLEKINFKPGQRVKKDEILFQIDPRQYQASLDQALASVEAQKAALTGAENDARLARELADQRAGPEIDAVIKAAKRDSAKAEVARALALVEEAKLNLEYCTIKAPIDGRISKNLVDVGNLVGRGEPTLLAEIVQAVPAYLSVDVSEGDVLKVRRTRERQGDDSKGVDPGQVSPGKWRPCELALSDEQAFPHAGRIDYIAPEMNAQTGTLNVRTRFENTDEVLLAGLYARVRFPMSTSKAMLVPEAALLSDQQGRYALVVNDKDDVEIRRVKIGGLEGTLRIVTEGLTLQDRVVTLGVLKARPGAKVTPKVEPIKTDAINTPDAAPAAASSDAAKPDTAKPDPTKPDPAKSNPTKPEGGKSPAPAAPTH